MELKLYLNKFLKSDNIESYTLKSLHKLKEAYDDFMEKTEGTDPDFPLINFGNSGKSITKGKTNVSKAKEGSDEDQGPMMTQEQMMARERFNATFEASREKGARGDIFK